MLLNFIEKSVKYHSNCIEKSCKCRSRGDYRMSITELIGEATDYDKKIALEKKKPKSWCKSVSAFANGRGGKLIFGVADDDTIVGLANAEEDANIISEQIKERLDPIPNTSLSFY